MPETPSERPKAVPVAVPASKIFNVDVNVVNEVIGKTSVLCKTNSNLDSVSPSSALVQNHFLPLRKPSFGDNPSPTGGGSEIRNRVPGDSIRPRMGQATVLPRSRTNTTMKTAEPAFVPHCPDESDQPGRWHVHPYERDRLDTLIEKHANTWSKSESYVDFIRNARGRGDLCPTITNLPHPARTLLTLYQQEGTPAEMRGPIWTNARKAQALRRGPHKSARQGIQFLREEFADMIEKEQWVVLPASQVMDMTELRLSPLGLVPQRGRRDRMISDYSYYDVNRDTEPLARQEAMQFGRALQRILDKIHHANDQFGPVYLAKIDLSDGFYRLWVRPEDTIKLAVLMPTREGEPPLVGIPLVNPMGWAESPPNFCACTETVADLANIGLSDPAERKAARVEPHRLDEISETLCEEVEAKVNHQAVSTPPLRPATAPDRKPLAYWDIYVDDYLGAVQGNRWKRREVKRILLRALDQVFRPLDPNENPKRQEPASIKKMKKGDARWTTKKVMLGWELDTVDKTIRLPPHRVERLREILSSIKPKQRAILTKDWHKIVGELRSMALALPGSLGLFSLLQEAFRHQEKDRPRLRLSKALHGFLEDFRNLAEDVASRPTRIAELVPDKYPATLGACDAAGSGMGGIHFIPLANGKTQPVLWRSPFPDWVRDRLVSFDNPQGDITNSDLELAGAVAHNDILAQYANVAERTTLNMYDNTPTVYWQRKGATTTTGPAAYLLRLQALHQRQYRYVPRRDYIPGPSNTMADTLSREHSWTDTELLTHFNALFPQELPWTLLRLSKPMRSKLMLALSRRRCDGQFAPDIGKRRIDIARSGMTTVCQKTSTQISGTLREIRSSASKCLPHDIATDELPQAVDPSSLGQWRTPCVRWGRASPWWGPKTPQRTAGGKPSIGSAVSCELMRKTTSLRTG